MCDTRWPVPVAAPPPSAPQDKYHRRRATVGVGLVAVLALAIGVSYSRGGVHHRAAGGNRDPRPPHRAAAAQPTPAQRQALARRAEEGAVSRVLSYTPAITAGGSRGDELALTFDDGPGPYTQQLVRTLDALHVKATFFAIGSQERYFSAGTLAELHSGDAVGDHTETHPMMGLLSAHEQHEQLFEQILRVQILGGPTPHLFRPPYGSFDATTFRELRALHLLMVLWSDDTSDYAKPGAAAIAERALAGARPGAIILMHDGGGDRSQTIAALPAIVRGLRRRGLHPVTIPRLLLDDPPPRGRPLPTSLAGD
jgi:peptidoglycan-N-acetylglucosamine deacetylase